MRSLLTFTLLLLFTCLSAQPLAPDQAVAIALEHKQMLNEARGEIARLVVTTTERVLAKKLTDADRASYNDAAAKELSGV